MFLSSKKLDMKYIALTFFSFFLYMSFNGQEPILHEKGTYTDSAGKLYIQKDLPIYLWLSTSPDENGEKTRLQSQSCKKYSNPLYLDTEGFNTVRTPSKVDTVTKIALVPREDIIFEVYADSYSPKTNLKPAGGKFVRVGGKKYTASGIKVRLTSKDALAGVNTVYYSVNGEAYKKYTSEISFDQEKEYTIKYYSVDNVGNAEKPKAESFVIDKTGPVGAIEVLGKFQDNIVSGKARLKINFTDAGSGITTVNYTIDNSSIARYSEPIYVSWLSEGKHVIEYYTVDKVGNESEKMIYEFFIDKTPPKIIDELIGDVYYLNGKEFVSGHTQLKLTAIDNKAGVEEVYYSFNGNDYSLYTNPVDIPSGGNSMSIKFYALDKVGNNNKNSSSSSGSRMSYTDLSGPRLNFKFTTPYYESRDTFFVSSKTLINLKAYDKETQVKNIEYALNKGTKQLYEVPFSVDKEGLVKVDYWGTDMLNNMNKGDFEFIVDNTGPEIFERFSSPSLSEKNNKPVYPSNVTLFLSATDAMVGYMKMQYSINGGKMSVYDGQISGLKKNTEFSVKIISYDKLGNEKEKVISFFTGE